MNYKDMTREQIDYQLEMSDNYEFSYGYAKELQRRIDKAIEYIEKLKIDYEVGISSGIFYELDKISGILKGE